MYLLSCPNCQADVPVTPAQAGDSIACPKCAASVQIPKLGELRQLAPAAPTADASRDASKVATGGGGSIGFIALMLLAVAALLAAGYCGIRWAAIEVNQTSESHMKEIRENYGTAEPASMILEFEHMESQSLDLTAPFDYQITNDKKAQWGRNALISVGAAVIFAIGGVMLGSRRQSS
ncbi:hypothetical protein LOC67_01820 [Stieleria sp. JC731]|uniref:hypothetical protein n=1 Tax=Pirellulaceae TaxID=2691357 RepID=UPI001E3AF24A|nr:hypothetical protein [Stieleria sp. JC731]MCC9599281.1 hypothetical protein [Stieleria sp. JC731]